MLGVDVISHPVGVHYFDRSVELAFNGLYLSIGESQEAYFPLEGDQVAARVLDDIGLSNGIVANKLRYVVPELGYAAKNLEDGDVVAEGFAYIEVGNDLFPPVAILASMDVCMRGFLRARLESFVRVGFELLNATRHGGQCRRGRVGLRDLGR